MNATGAVQDSGSFLCERRAYQPKRLPNDAGPIRSSEHQAFQIKRALREAGLTMAEVSLRTRARFGEKSPYFIPRTFLYKQKAGITPHICQVLALSEVTGYGFAHCMSVCGFDLAMIVMLQLTIPNKRTIIVTPIHNLSVKHSFVCALNATGRGQSRYCYAKIGTHDAVVHPQLSPGSIVRADMWFSPHALKDCAAERHLWLVEHPAGLTCCHLKLMDDDEIVLLPNRAPLSPWPLRLGMQARILGLVDREFHDPEVEDPDCEERPTQPEAFVVSSCLGPRVSFSRFLRAARRRTGLTFREAHTTTMQIAHFLQNERYQIAVGLLSDYEATDKLPRHIEKIVSLCVTYGIDPCELLKVSGVEIGDSHRHSLCTARERVDSSVRATNLAAGTGKLGSQIHFQ